MLSIKLRDVVDNEILDGLEDLAFVARLLNIDALGGYKELKVMIDEGLRLAGDAAYCDIVFLGAAALKKSISGHNKNDS